MRARSSFRAAAERKSLLFSRVIKKSTYDFDGPIPMGSTRPRRVIPADQVMLESVESLLSQAAAGNDEGGLPEYTEDNGPSKPLTTSPGDRVASPDNVSLVNNLVEEKVRAFEKRFQEVKELAYKDGYAQGKSKGYEEGISITRKIEDLLAGIHNDLKSQHETFISRAGETLGKLALEIAQAVIGEAIMKSSNELFEYNLKRCLDVLAGAGPVRIRINPVEYEHARECLQAVKPKDSDRFSFEFVPDPSITPGGCFIETSSGAIDARIESQFEQIKSNFLQLV
jgi:flagellar assembly protein FliH